MRCSAGGAVAGRHIGRPHAEVRLIDANLLLHGRRSQGDRAPRQLPSESELVLGAAVLHPVSARKITRFDQVADRSTGTPERMGVDQEGGGGFDDGAALIRRLRRMPELRG